MHSSSYFSPTSSRRSMAAPLSNIPTQRSYQSNISQQQSYHRQQPSSQHYSRSTAHLPTYRQQYPRAHSIGPPMATDVSIDVGGNYSQSPIANRRAMFRQNRSFDSSDAFGQSDSLFRPIGGVVDFPTTSATTAGGTNRPLYYPNPISQQPLSIATGGGGSQQQGPLSNPTASTSAFWQQSAAMQNSIIDGQQQQQEQQFSRDPYSMPYPVLQREYDMLRREFEISMQKLNSTMNSIKTFWSPELKRERQLRKEESAKLALVQDQLRMGSQESQKQSNAIRQLQSELQCQYDIHRTIRDTDIETVPRDEYDAVRLENERIQRDIRVARDNIRQLEMQIDAQRQTVLARDDSVRKLLDMLQSKGQISYNSAQERLELERVTQRSIELDSRCRQLESALAMRDSEQRRLDEECASLNERLRQYEYAQTTATNDERDSTAYMRIVESKDARIIDLEQQLQFYEHELNRMRFDQLNQPRDYTDKSVSSHEFQTVKLKMEKSELELSHKMAELQTTQTRLQTADEQISDLRKHLQVLKEANSAKEQQLTLFQGDIDALRTKLETKNEALEQKQSSLTQAQMEASRLSGELSDMREQLKIRENKLSMMQSKIDALESQFKDKERELESCKQRLHKQPDMQQQRHMQELMDESAREKDRLSRQINEMRDAMECDRIENLESHRSQLRDMRIAIDSLQKEITDRQILIESQNEKIADMSRELNMLRQASVSGRPSKDVDANEIDALNQELFQARTEVDRLLKMVQNFERERQSMNGRVRELQRLVDESRQQLLSSSTGMRSIDSLTQRSVGDQSSSQLRIEELEEALRESVSITAERELVIAQQKQMNQQMQMQINDYKNQVADLRRSSDALNSSALEQSRVDKDQLIRSLKNERKKHLEEVLQLKHEALVAAIAEKDAHIALLEMSRDRPQDEIETLRRHKEKLIRKLKEENERRMSLLNESATEDGNSIVGSLAKELKSSPVDQLVHAIRCVELQKKKLLVFIDQLIASILEMNPDLLNGLPRTQQSQGIEIKYLVKLSHDQLLLELQQRENDSLQLQHYANQLLQRLFHVQPGMVRRAMRLLDSFGISPTTPTTAIIDSKLSVINRNLQLARGSEISA